MFRIVRSAEDPDNEDLTAAGQIIIVCLNLIELTLNGVIGE